MAGIRGIKWQRRKMAKRVLIVLIQIVMLPVTLPIKLFKWVYNYK